MGDLLLEVKNLKTHFHISKYIARAVDGVSFNAYTNETLGIVGESGCGKSVTALSILNVVPHPGKIVEGEILLHDKDGNTVDVTSMDPEGKQIRSIRGKEVGLIFQEPMSSLSPIHTVGHQLIETFLIHFPYMSKDEAEVRAIKILGDVGLANPEKILRTYTFELSGGMRQRAMIAIALACDPRLLIADEPTTAIDVTIQAQILELLKEIQSERGMSVMMITHDLGVIAEIADKVLVMYFGHVVEYGTVFDLFDSPMHPYTQALMESVPTYDKGKELSAIGGSVPPAFTTMPGCEFAPRCVHFMPGKCDKAKPPMFSSENGQEARCFLYE